MNGISSHVNSFFSSMCWRLGDVLVDPGDEWEGFAGVKAVLLTHAHYDHIYGIDRVLELNPDVTVYTNEAGRGMLFDDRRNMSRYIDVPYRVNPAVRVVTVADGETVELGDGLTVRAVFTPGHNASCVTWVTDSYVFSGDSLIPGVKTVTNLPGGDRRQAAESEALIRRLAEGRTLCPGHENNVEC